MRGWIFANASLKPELMGNEIIVRKLIDYLCSKEIQEIMIQENIDFTNGDDKPMANGEYFAEKLNRELAEILDIEPFRSLIGIDDVNNSSNGFVNREERECVLNKANLKNATDYYSCFVHELIHLKQPVRINIDYPECGNDDTMPKPERHIAYLALPDEREARFFEHLAALCFNKYYPAYTLEKDVLDISMRHLPCRSRNTITEIFEYVRLADGCTPIDIPRVSIVARMKYKLLHL